MEIIKTVNLHKSFGDLHVLQGVNQTIHKGEVISVIGPSGGGKSTFLRCLNLLEQPEKGQMEAARSLGMSEGQAMLKIILPQAVRNILPALGNEFIMMLKETSLASTFFLGDLMTSYAIVKGVTYLTLEPMTIVALIYLLMTFPLSKIVERFEKKMASPNSYKKSYAQRKKKLMSGGKF